jgi:hypothetical protein
MPASISRPAGGSRQQAIQQAQEVMGVDPKSAAAYYVEGCGQLRLSNTEQAVQALQTAKNLMTVNPVSFQLGRVSSRWQFEDALREFKEVTDYETNKISPLLWRPSIT